MCVFEAPSAAGSPPPPSPVPQAPSCEEDILSTRRPQVRPGAGPGAPISQEQRAGLLSEPAPWSQVVPVGLDVSLRVLSCSLLFPVNSPAPLHQEKDGGAEGCRKARSVGPSSGASGRPPGSARTPSGPPVYSSRLSHFSKEDCRSQVPPGAHFAVSVSTCVSPLTVRLSGLFADSRSRGVRSRLTP